MDQPFNPADPATWLSRGRSIEHASLIAEAWQRFPDLAPAAPLEDRITRIRLRVEAMRPVFLQIEQAARREHHERNFAFTATKLARGEGGDHEIAILRARDQHGLGWDEAVAFANGWIASHLGWTFSPPRSGYKPEQAAAYRKGFTDAGSNTDDLFDAARRQFRAAERVSNQLPAPLPSSPARPLPSSWAKPADHPRPTQWERRLIILSHAHAFGECLINDIANHPGSHGSTVIILSPDRGYIDVRHPRVERSQPITRITAEQIINSAAARMALRSLIGDRDYDDILIVAEGDYLKILDAHSSELPLCRTMERAQNTRLQRKAHLRTWLERGCCAGETKAAGHIRWSKQAQGVEGRLGEVTARYEGSAGRGLHLVCLRKSDGTLATGYVTPHGRGLDPRIIVSSKARLKRDMARALRSFAASTRFSTPSSSLSPPLLAVAGRSSVVQETYD